MNDNVLISIPALVDDSKPNYTIKLNDQHKIQYWSNDDLWVLLCGKYDSVEISTGDLIEAIKQSGEVCGG